MLQPDVVSARFGAPLDSVTSVLFFRVYLSRNLAIILAGLLFLAFDYRKPLAILMTTIAVLPLADATFLWAHLGKDARVHFHLEVLVPVVFIAGLLWVRALASHAGASQSRALSELTPSQSQAGSPTRRFQDP